MLTGGGCLTFAIFRLKEALEPVCVVRVGLFRIEASQCAQVDSKALVGTSAGVRIETWELAEAMTETSETSETAAETMAETRVEAMAKVEATAKAETAEIAETGVLLLAAMLVARGAGRLGPRLPVSTLPLHPEVSHLPKVVGYARFARLLLSKCSCLVVGWGCLGRGEPPCKSGLASIKAATCGTLTNAQFEPRSIGFQAVPDGRPSF